MEKNNEMFAQFKKWADSQGINYDNADLSTILGDMFKWSKTEGKQYFNQRTLTMRNPQRIREIENSITDLKSLFLDSDSEAKIEIRDNIIIVETDYLGLFPDEISKFLSAVSTASHIDITPTNNNKISISIEFSGGEIKMKIPSQK